METVTTTKIDLVLMNYGKVRNYLVSLGITPEKKLFTVYIMDEVKPYDFLTGENTFIPLVELEAYLSIHIVRHLQVMFVTYMVERRFVWKLPKESVNSIQL